MQSSDKRKGSPIDEVYHTCRRPAVKQVSWRTTLVTLDQQPLFALRVDPHTSSAQPPSLSSAAQSTMMSSELHEWQYLPPRQRLPFRYRFRKRRITAVLSIMNAVVLLAVLSVVGFSDSLLGGSDDRTASAMRP